MQRQVHGTHSRPTFKSKLLFLIWIIVDLCLMLCIITLQVYAPQIKQFYYNDFNTYIFPLENGMVTLGGCRNYDDYNLEVDEFDTQSIIKRCSDIVSSLKGAKILSQWVGLRPHRNVIRLEIENLGKLKVPNI